VIIPIAVILFSISSLSEFDMTEGRKKRGFITYREYTRDKAIEIWKDHPFWGVGPGMFGGAVSVIFKSHFYEEYNFLPMPKSLLKQYQGIDQFWPNLLAEMGIIGIVSFAGLLISLFIAFFVLRKSATSDEMRGLFTGLTIITIVIIIYTFSTTLKLTSLFFTYSAFAGMGLGCINKNRNNK